MARKEIQKALRKTITKFYYLLFSLRYWALKISVFSMQKNKNQQIGEA